MKKINIRAKIILLFLSIFLVAMFSFLIITQTSVRKDGANSIKAIDDLKVTATYESEKELKNQANLYLSRLVAAQATNSDYIFKNIEAQINLTYDYAVTLWNDPHFLPGSREPIEDLANIHAGRELLDNPELNFYYFLAPNVEKENIYEEIELLGNMSTVFRSIVKNNKEFDILPLAIDGVYLGTESGIFYNMSWLAYYNKDYDPRMRPWYTNSKELGTLNWSELYIDAALDIYVITCSKPCYDNQGNLKGVIGIDVNIIAMLDIIASQIDDIGEAFLVDKNGNMIIYDLLSNNLKEVFNNKQNLMEVGNVELEKIANQIIDGQEGVREVYFGERSKLIGYSPIGSTEWSLVLVGSTDKIMKHVDRTRYEIEKASGAVQNNALDSITNTIRYTLIIFGIILAVTIIILIKFSTLITEPLSKLTKQVEKIGTGNLDESIDIKTGDEIEVLSNSFNLMLSDLKTYIKNLQETTAEKERVEFRTAVVRESRKNIKSLLDNIGQGILHIDNDLIVQTNYSKQCEEIFSKEIIGAYLPELFISDSDEREEFSKVLKAIFLEKSKLKKEVYKSLLPAKLEIGDRLYSIKYNFFEDDKDDIMLVIDDISEKNELERLIDEEKNRTQMIVNVILGMEDFKYLYNDYLNFVNVEIDDILQSKNTEIDKLIEIQRRIHTFKGNFAQYGMYDAEEALNNYEDYLDENIKLVKEKDINIGKIIIKTEIINLIENDISKISQKVHFQTDLKSKTIKLKKDRFDLVMYRIKNLNADEIIIENLRSLLHRNVKEMVKSYSGYIDNLAVREQKLIKPISITGADVFVDYDRYRPFIQSLVHLFRNSIRHGIELPDERELQGKKREGQLYCEVKKMDKEFMLTIGDDGRGIDVDKIRKKAENLNLYSSEELNKMSEKQILDLIFMDKFSTSENIGIISGRGVGLASVKFEVEKLGGTIDVQSTIYQGTRFEIFIPVELN